MKILGLDFETTGLDPSQDRITEVGAVLWHWETSTPIIVFSEFVNPSRPIPPEVTKLTGITDELVEEYGKTEDAMLADLDYLFERADYVMAHNGNDFDKPFLMSAYARCDGGEPTIPWLDTKTDIKYPEEIATSRLRYLASEHNFLNPFSHRAVFDVLTMLKIASCYDIHAMIARASEPTFYVQALVSYDDREKAKTRGYHWHSSRRIWWRALKESDYVGEQAACGFQTSLLASCPE